jgi:hypothetical protein
MNIVQICTDLMVLVLREVDVEFVEQKSPCLLSYQVLRAVHRSDQHIPCIG